LAALRAVDTPTICNALELAAGGRSTSGFTTRPAVCSDPALPAIVGFARTARIRASTPSTQSADELRASRLQYYGYVASGPKPTVVVIEDEDLEPIGAFWGEVNVAIHKGFGLEGTLTNGLVRDLGAHDPGYQVVAGGIGPSHAFVHVTAIDCPVTVLGLAISPGDLVHADRHGAAMIPAHLLDKMPVAIDRVARRERPILAAARRPGFDIAALSAVWGEAEDLH
jgi:regulator of RNase E activity RraA